MFGFSDHNTKRMLKIAIQWNLVLKSFLDFLFLFFSMTKVSIVEKFYR